MADITKIGSVPAPSWASYSAGAGNIIGGPSRTVLHIADTDRVGSGYLAGEAIGPWDAVFLFTPTNATVPLVYRSFADATNGTRSYGATSQQSARVLGYAANQVQAGEAVTILGVGVEANYTTVSASGSQPIDLYLSGVTIGGLATAPVSIAAVVQPPVAQYMGDGRIRNKSN